MKCYIAYRFTGEDIEERKEIMKRICDIFTEHKHDNYCTLWDEEQLSKKPKKDLFKHAYNEIDKADCLVAFINSEKKSEGMLIEIGYAVAKGKKFVLIIHKDGKTVYLKDIADQVIEFENLDELKDRLKDLE